MQITKGLHCEDRIHITKIDNFGTYEQVQILLGGTLKTFQMAQK